MLKSRMKTEGVRSTSLENDKLNRTIRATEIELRSMVEETKDVFLDILHEQVKFVERSNTEDLVERKSGEVVVVQDYIVLSGSPKRKGPPNRVCAFFCLLGGVLCVRVAPTLPVNGTGIAERLVSSFYLVRWQAHTPLFSSLFRCAAVFACFILPARQFLCVAVSTVF